MSHIKVGQPGRTLRSNILPGRSATGERVLKLDSGLDRKVDSYDPALVIRKESESGEWAWQPVSDVAELEGCIKAGTSNDIGLWTDEKQRRGWFRKKSCDGVIQDNEVERFLTRWESNFDHKKNEGQHLGYPTKVYKHYSSVDVDKVRVESSALPGGTLVQLIEPSTIDRTRECNMQVLVSPTWGPIGSRVSRYTDHK